MDTTIVVALIAAAATIITAIATVVTTAMVRSGRRQKEAADQLSVTNGQRPGFMIEKTYELAHSTFKAVTDLDKKFDLHAANPDAHNPSE